MKYSSTLTVQSNAFPGVSFKLRKMSEARRSEFRLAIASIQDQIDANSRESARLMALLPKDGDETAIDPQLQVQIEGLLRKQTALISGELNQAYVRWGLKSIDGLEHEDDDQPIVDADALISVGPPELFVEIAEAIIRASGMSEADLKNFALPSTSGAVTDGSGQNTTAETASNRDGSEPPATAQSTSPNS
jgi:hypothetical protein